MWSLFLEYHFVRKDTQKKSIGRQTHETKHHAKKNKKELRTHYTHSSNLLSVSTYNKGRYFLSMSIANIERIFSSYFSKNCATPLISWLYLCMTKVAIPHEYLLQTKKRTFVVSFFGNCAHPSNLLIVSTYNKCRDFLWMFLVNNKRKFSPIFIFNVWTIQILWLCLRIKRSWILINVYGQ